MSMKLPQLFFSAYLYNYKMYGVNKMMKTNLISAFRKINPFIAKNAKMAPNSESFTLAHSKRYSNFDLQTLKKTLKDGREIEQRLMTYDNGFVTAITTKTDANNNQTFFSYVAKDKPGRDGKILERVIQDGKKFVAHIIEFNRTPGQYDATTRYYSKALPKVEGVTRPGVKIQNQLIEHANKMFNFRLTGK